MWGTLEKISEQVTKYSSRLGLLWYILVFIFRLIIVVSLGGAVYGDEQSAFVCGEKSLGCSNMCYDQFAKLPHLRFWAFQLIGVISPTVFFHFYSIVVSGEIQKLQKTEEKMKRAEEGDGDEVFLREEKKMLKRTKSLGRVKVRHVYSGNELKEIFYTRKIKFAYNISVLCRLVIEGIFIYYANVLFNLKVNQCYGMGIECQESFFDIWWYDVPGSYYCKPITPHDNVYQACNRHFKLLPGGRTNGFVPCNVSRPFEKTIFLRYMMTLSVICFVICVFELLRAIFKKLFSKKWLKKPKRSKFSHTPNNNNNNSETVFQYDSLAPPTVPSKYGAPFHNTIEFPLKFGFKDGLEIMTEKSKKKETLSFEKTKSYV